MGPKLVIFLALIAWFSATSDSFAQERPEERRLKAENLPERIEVRIIDVTKITLTQRPIFSDHALPDIPRYLIRYPKESLWNLPGILLPKRIKPRIEDYHVDRLISVSLLPGIPGGFNSEALALKEANETAGAVKIKWLTLGNSRTDGRGRYNLLGISVYGSHNLETSRLRANLGYNVKGLGWLKDAESEEMIRQDLALLSFDLALSQRLSENTSSIFRVDLNRTVMMGEWDVKNEATDIGFRLEADTSYPFLNPIKLGFLGRYISTRRGETESQISLFRMYGRDNFEKLGPFVFGFGLESVLYGSPQGGARFAISPSLDIMTLLGEFTLLKLGVNWWKVTPPEVNGIFYRDYTALNPDLRSERSSEVTGGFGFRPKGIEFYAEGFYQIRDNMALLERLDDKILAWYPVNLNAHIYGLRLNLKMKPMDGVEAKVGYVHEFHKVETADCLPYRPKDRLEWEVLYKAPSGLNLRLEGGLIGSRYADKNGKKALDTYAFFRPLLSLPFGEGITGLLRGTIYTSKPQIMEGYGLPQTSLDFGVRVRF